MQHVPSINKNLVSSSLLCRDMFKVVLEANKVVMLKHGLFIGKGYECSDLFHFSLSDFCNKSVNIFVAILIEMMPVSGTHSYVT
jgi:hypothetical protein